MNWGRPMEKIPLIMGVRTFSKTTHSSTTSIFIVIVCLSLQKYNSAIEILTEKGRCVKIFPICPALQPDYIMCMLQVKIK